MKNFLKNDLITLLLRLLLLYVIWFVCRVVFYIQNSDIIGPLGWSEIPSLLRGALIFDTVSLIYVNALFVILSLLPFRFRADRWYRTGLKWLFCVTNAVAIFINTADGVYFHYVKKRFTADEFYYADNNQNNLSIIFGSIADNWAISLFGAFIIGIMIWSYNKIPYNPTQIKGRVSYFAVNLVILLVAITLSVGGIRGGFGSSRPLTLSNATLYTSSNLKANLILSNPFSLLRTVGNKAINYTKFFEPAELDSIYTPYHYPTPGDPLLKGRNVVIVILESFSAEHSALLNPDLYPQGDGFTPFLDSLMRDGYYLTNGYASGRKSIDALPSTISSIPSYQTPFVLLPNSIAPMQSLPYILGELGYQTMFFNGSEHGSMGFGAYCNLSGVKQYYSKENYEEEIGKDDYDGWWGIWDLPFMSYMSKKLDSAKQPFIATLFTLSSHHPFKVPVEFDSKLAEGKTKIHKGVTYTDIAVREFMKQSSTQSWYNNTIFVFVGDHVSSEVFAPKTRTSTGSTNVVAFIYTPDGAIKGVDSSPFSQVDIMPTLLGLLGNEKPYFAFGRDIFGEPERMAMATNAVGDSYQAITDSVALLFDGNNVISVYGRSDTLQLKDIRSENNEYIKRVERELKARLQQYYQHVEKGDYLIQESK